MPDMGGVNCCGLCDDKGDDHNNRRTDSRKEAPQEQDKRLSNVKDNATKAPANEDRMTETTRK